MTWFKLSDDWLFSAPMQTAGREARALWVAAGACHCAKDDTDGRIHAGVLKLLAAAADVNLKRATAALVEAGLWHDPETIKRCPECLEVARKKGGLGPGDFFMHAFLRDNLDAQGKHDAIARERELRRKALRRDVRLCGQIRKRDQDLCQYCGVHTRWEGLGADRRSKDLGELDHVDPWGGNDQENVVVACKGCNSLKGDRNPLQWFKEADGRLLLRSPGPSVDPSWVDHGSDHGS